MAFFDTVPHNEWSMTEITRELLEHLTEFDTALLANTIGYIDPTPPEEWYMGGSIRSVTPGLGPTVGVAYTCEVDTSSPGGAPATDDYLRQVEEMESDGRPVVWVVKTVGSRPDHECVLGDGMGKLLHGAGCIGLVTDGGVRDVPGLMTIPFAVYARGLTIHHGHLRFRAAGCPIEIGGITVRQGDVIHADAGGVIRIPAGSIMRLPGEAVRMLAFEREAHLILRRTDMKASQKHRAVRELLAKYDFRRD
jgi:regulator of RNase E activity RraA